MFCARFRYALAFLLICVTASAQSPVYLTNLRCENLTDPVALEKITPRLSWNLTGSDRGITQASYHILVATSADKSPTLSKEVTRACLNTSAARLSARISTSPLFVQLSAGASVT